MVRIVLQGPSQQHAFRRVVGSLESAQQFVQRVKHLFGKALADLVLVLPAIAKQSGKTLLARHKEQPILPEQGTHRG